MRARIALPQEVPRSSSTLAWRGLSGLGDRDRAVADYKAALALDPAMTTLVTA